MIIPVLTDPAKLQLIPMTLVACQIVNVHPVHAVPTVAISIPPVQSAIMGHGHARETK